MSLFAKKIAIIGDIRKKLIKKAENKKNAQET